VAEERGNKEQNPEGEEEQGSGFTFQPDYRASVPTFYANFALISHTGDDLCIDFCLIAPPHHVNAEAKTISVPVIARVMTSPGLADGLIQALRTQLAKQRSEREAGRMMISAPRQEADSHDKPWRFRNDFLNPYPIF
jgi:hypothetical protein